MTDDPNAQRESELSAFPYTTTPINDIPAVCRSPLQHSKPCKLLIFADPKSFEECIQTW